METLPTYHVFRISTNVETALRLRNMYMESGLTWNDFIVSLLQSKPESFDKSIVPKKTAPVCAATQTYYSLQLPIRMQTAQELRSLYEESGMTWTQLLIWLMNAKENNESED